tara:strand:- start:24676 stop:25710 length:1035 start_codon:yes stop_codon:yes gene_type:complete
MRFLLLFISSIYGLLIFIRNKLFDLKILKSKIFNIPIICVGNISSGGTGKTPQIEYLIDFLSNKNIAVLSRGYARKSTGFIIVDETSSSKIVGDEPLQIKQKFPQIKVFVCESRRKGIKKIMKLYPNTELILMDDGFQHRWIKAGIYILLNNYEKPFYSDNLIPLGSLREFKNGAERADIVITTKCPNLENNEKELIKSKIKLFNNKNTYFSSIKYLQIKPVFNAEKISDLFNYNVILVTSIADSNNLIKYLEAKENKVNHIRYPDHYNFRKKDIEKIIYSYKKSNYKKNIILITEKDKVKINKFEKYFEKIDIYFIPIKTKIHNSAKFNTEILKYVRKNQKKR